jgi:DNA-binding LacI/PurR family transcriptional regulator
MPVLADVAKMAGVSLSTASRALTGRTRVSVARKAAIDAAALKLGYRPNAAAQTLVSGRRSVVGVLARNTLRFGYAATLQGIEEAARAAGNAVMIAVVESEAPDHVRAAADLALSQPLAGAIVIEFDRVGIETLKALPATLPVVAAAGAVRKRTVRPYAFLDDEAAGRHATNYLLSLGHKTVYHASIPSTRRQAGREQGWRRALEDAGITAPGVYRAGYSSRSGYEVGLRVARDPSITAILCGNDELAIGVMRALREHGKRVPEDVSVMGFDDQPFSEMWLPPLTTVAQDFQDLGRRAYGLLRQWIESGVKPKNSVAVPELVIRTSTGPPRSG